MLAQNQIFKLFWTERNENIYERFKRQNKLRKSYNGIFWFFSSLFMEQSHNPRDVNILNFFSENVFLCENNRTIPIEQRCDGSYNCRYIKPYIPSDLSDEKHCRKFHTMFHTNPIEINDFSFFYFVDLGKVD